MKVKRGPEWFLQVLTELYPSFGLAREEADSFEIDFDLNCVVERVGAGFKIFCRGNKYHDSEVEIR